MVLNGLEMVLLLVIGNCFFLFYFLPAKILTYKKFKMKTKITIYHSKLSVKGVTHRESNIMASCKSVPAHRMDCERYVTTEILLQEDLDLFVKRLKNFVYEDDFLEVEIIDKRDFSLPVYPYF